jgi:hypothetical protein
MKTKILQILIPGVKWAGVISSGAAAFSTMLPPEWAFYGLLISNVASASKDTLLRVGDKLDDGKINKSFKA